MPGFEPAYVFASHCLRMSMFYAYSYQIAYVSRMWSLHNIHSIVSRLVFQCYGWKLELRVYHGHYTVSLRACGLGAGVFWICKALSNGNRYLLELGIVSTEVLENVHGRGLSYEPISGLRASMANKIFMS